MKTEDHKRIEARQRKADIAAIEAGKTAPEAIELAAHFPGLVAAPIRFSKVKIPPRHPRRHEASERKIFG